MTPLLSADRADDLGVQFTLIGNANNAADETELGSVPYNFEISQSPVTTGTFARWFNAIDPLGTGRWVTPGVSLNNNAQIGVKYRANSPGGLAIVKGSLASQFIKWLNTGTITPNVSSGDIDKGPIHFPTSDELYKAAFFDSQTSAYSKSAKWHYGPASPGERSRNLTMPLCSDLLIFQAS
jgi:hypothetical protein